ncbi:MAG TPA: acyl carrier protein [Sediminibacterium sp.]|uniref:acyl carrier protein n=1 Tax=Sediminibacterium sp. TaxID=1917865 RepID=UPI0008D0B086|nr:acyl carrier protein [Sediminibacterium sp.]OHC84530.1 MAG: hypothetical protein A2472_11240 [Sphingobacteriia bacterium RIFOXYC2_FULL_35_18]OHC89043.1 MAG: hypothetical protein A2546_09110 [Sphingobacteriia bacterium RIFOXYD2_FULL_35_12]HLD53091.1 acyl carrier protein [Sediminibacterium sp.]
MITQSTFLENLKIQFESTDSEKITLDTSFESLETFDSLTKYSIIAFIKDDYNVELDVSQFSELTTPQILFNFLLEKLKSNE